MQDIQQETLNECIHAEQSASVVLWEIDLTEVGGDRYFFCNEQNEKGESVTWQSRQYQAYPIQGRGARRIRKKSYAKVFRASVRAETSRLPVCGSAARRNRRLG